MLYAAALLLGVLLISPALGQHYDQSALLSRMLDLDRLTRPPPAGETGLLFSSYDRDARKIENGRYVRWDANEDVAQFDGKTQDGWDVMARVEGPGVINRIWLSNAEGELRITLDGEPRITASAKDIFAGVVEPFGDPFTSLVSEDAGAGLLFPIGFDKSCEIACKGFRSAYQIDVTKLPRSAQVVTFTPELNAASRETLERVAATLTNGMNARRLFGGRRVGSHAIQQDVSRGNPLRWEVDKPGTIRAFYVATTDRVEPRELYALHNCVLRVTWDDDETPAIETPLAEFFGAGFQRTPYASLVVGTDFWSDMPGEFPLESWFMYNYFPMPFAKRARIEIESRNDRKIGLMLYLRVDRDAPPRDSLRFNARFRSENPCRTFDYPLLETAGRGRVVGAVLNVDCPRAEWWGEGDHKIWVDDDEFPSFAGTSTPDLFGSIATGGADDPWKRVAAPRIGPFSGVTRAGEYGKNSAYRWFIADSIPFQEEVRFTIENWQRNKAYDVYYASVAYWYGEPGRVGEFAALPPRRLDVPGRRVPGGVEIEGYVRGEGWGRSLKQRFANAELSGGEAVVITTTAPVEIAIPVTKAGRYRLKLYTVPGRTFSTIEVRDANDQPIGVATYDRNANSVYTLGEADFVAGSNYVRVLCARSATLDCWGLEPLSEPRP